MMNLPFTTFNTWTALVYIHIIYLLLYYNIKLSSHVKYWRPSQSDWVKLIREFSIANPQIKD